MEDAQNSTTEISEIKLAISALKKAKKIAECFSSDKNKCKGKIKQAHSLQKNGRLSIIEGRVNGNQAIYTLTEPIFNERGSIQSLKPIGKNMASTFFGFCDYHDTVLFSPIENNKFDNQNDEHCFLHSYRSFAHSYHLKKEQLRGYTSESKYTQLIGKESLDLNIKGVMIAIEEADNNKVKLETLLTNKQYDGLEYFVYTIPALYPIACSSQINPEYSYTGTPINIHDNGSVPFSSIMLTVLPDKEQTIIIFACFPDDAKAVLFIDELEKLYPVQLEKAISSILIHYAENTFFAPALWNKLGIQGQNQLCMELENSLTCIPESFPISKINFFNTAFSAKNLGIL